MRIDLGDRARALMDSRSARSSKFEHVMERYDSLMKFAL